jgi:hypothetical protein
LFWVIEAKTLIHVFVSITQQIFKLDNFSVIFFVLTIYKKCCIYFSTYSRILNWILFSIYRFLLIQGKNYQVHVFVVIHKISKIANFICNYLENDNDSYFVFFELERLKIKYYFAAKSNRTRWDSNLTPLDLTPGALPLIHFYIKFRIFKFAYYFLYAIFSKTITFQNLP